MWKYHLDSLRSPAIRLLRDTGAANTIEAALFAAAVVAVSALAFSATTGSTSRAYTRLAVAFGSGGQPQCDPAASSGCETGWTQPSAGEPARTIRASNGLHPQAGAANDSSDGGSSPRPR
jgi:hypothetical protein